jgi:hypothetical protein
LIYANCQYAGIGYFLHKYFSEISAINNLRINCIENYKLIKHQGAIDGTAFKQADIMIFQPIHSRHGKYSTDPEVEDNILTLLTPECEVLSFPYLYNPSFWCLIPPANIDGFVGDYAGIDTYLNKQVIESLKHAGCSLEDTLKLYDEGALDFKYQERFTSSLKILEQKEANLNIKASKFIAENCRTKRLFFTQNHPTTHLFIHCANQLLELLGTNYQFDSGEFPENVARLPGQWPHSNYDRAFWNFKFQIDYGGDAWYRQHIKKIFQQTPLN